MKTLILDNYDSYTYNLYQLIAKINGIEPIVIYNDAYTWEEVKAKFQFDNVVISPGPGSADVAKDFGICRDALLEKSLPILGVCLGHQGLGYGLGACIVSSPEIAHGKISRIQHQGDRLFEGIPSPFSVVRYHSLLLDADLPDGLEPIAWTEEGLLMAIRALDRPHWGVQFHPESIASEYGEALLRNFMALTKEAMLQSDHNQSASGKELLDSEDGTVREPLEIQQVVASASTASNSASRVMFRKLSNWYDAEQVFMELYRYAEPAFWLDSSRGDGNMSRFSFMGDTRGPLSKLVTYDAVSASVTEISSNGTRTVSTDIFAYLDQELARYAAVTPELPFDFNSGFVGYYGYEAKGDMGVTGPRAYPDAIFMLADRFIAFDRETREVFLVCLTESELDALHWFDSIEQELEHLANKRQAQQDELADSQLIDDVESAEFQYHIPYEEYLKSIEAVKAYLREGDSYEINLTNELRTEADLDPVELYRNVRRMNPAPYSAYLTFGEDLQLICSSPERFIRIGRERQIDAKPIKGTIRRGHHQVEDEQLKEQLRASEKDFSENLMIVDLLRNDLGKVCEVGSVEVPKLMDIESFETVHQLVSTITGQLKREVTVNACIKAVFPGGSMTGAPKKRSMEIIEKLEKRPRGAYAGAIGFLGLNGTADLNIVIRTIVRQGRQLSIGVGGAIVMDSDPELEFQEIQLKARALVEAIQCTLSVKAQSAALCSTGLR
ncbi:aminodeoxychorismate synthase component I [Paenibacillus sp. 1001270B_150601_E10]|uniref:aminodeoxychorismate synthase component I n=1 Tax=Paenibacillus sp. 1001270B_150601_E10 TaxID=2787079 RepID=UPI00189F1F4A|nr:aminodeoxychorismate synthase component I [Paenibacillus sp. 1001270B_150601_E10]